jgi:HD-like signal output (HDOD) protein
VKNWKTTANGILAAIIGAAGPLTAYLATINSPKAAAAAGIMTLAAAIARVWIGLLQNDALSPAQTGQIAITSVNSGVTPPN